MELMARAGTWLRDAGLAVPLLVVGLFGTRPASENQADFARTPDAVAYVLVVLAASSVVPRRRWPMATLAVAAVAVATYLLLGYPFGPILLCVPVAAYAFAVRSRPRRAAWGAVALFALTFAASLGRFVGDPDRWTALLAWAIAWAAVVAAPTAVGAVVAVRSEAAESVRDEQARRAVSEERLRMAQELHDVVGHGLAVIAMQAGVAVHVLDRSPDKVRDSLEAIQLTARESLDGLRGELERLRTPADGEAARRPLPGLSDVDGLLERIRAGGLPVDYRRDDAQLASVSPSVSAAAYRIVQESLTNVLRHAGPASATVSIRRSDCAVLVDVTDTGAGPQPADSLGGSGIRGMRERAESLGGRLDAGPAPGRGFAVRARLPTGEGPAP